MKVDEVRIHLLIRFNRGNKTVVHECRPFSFGLSRRRGVSGRPLCRLRRRAIQMVRALSENMEADAGKKIIQSPVTG